MGASALRRLCLFSTCIIFLINLASCKQDTSKTEALEEISSPPAFLIQDKTLDPICFLNDWSGSGFEEIGDGVSFYPISDCRVGEIIVEPVSAEANPDYVGASYSEDFYNDESDEVFTQRGYIAYRYIGEVKNLHAFIVVENGGGSGFFSSLALYELGTHETEDGDFQVLKKIRTYAGGDRCNGGLIDAEILNNSLAYRVHITPYDMLFLAGDPERDILKSKPAEEVISCAACCYASAYFQEDRFKSMRLNEDNAQYLESGVKGVMGCFDQLVELNISHGKIDFNLEHTQSFIREIEHSCLGRMEGE